MTNQDKFRAALRRIAQAQPTTQATTPPRIPTLPKNPPLKRASYREAVEWIALNDESGGVESLDLVIVSEYITTGLVADIFGADVLRVAEDIVRYRKKHQS